MEMIPTEEQEQAIVVRYLELKGHKFSHIPNSTFTKSWKVKIRNKQQGVRPGLPDLVIIVNDNLIWLEMKRTKGGVVSSAQKSWHTALEQAGQTIFIAKGADEAIALIKKFE